MQYTIVSELISLILIELQVRLHQYLSSLLEVETNSIASFEMSELPTPDHIGAAIVSQSSRRRA